MFLFEQIFKHLMTTLWDTNQQILSIEDNTEISTKLQESVVSQIIKNYQTLFSLCQNLSEYLMEYQTNLPTSIKLYPYLYKQTSLIIPTVQANLHLLEMKTFTLNRHLLNNPDLKWWQQRIKLINNFNQKIIQQMVYDVQNYYIAHPELTPPYELSDIYQKIQTTVHENPYTDGAGTGGPGNARSGGSKIIYI